MRWRFLFLFFFFFCSIYPSTWAKIFHCFRHTQTHKLFIYRENRRNSKTKIKKTKIHNIQRKSTNVDYYSSTLLHAYPSYTLWHFHRTNRRRIVEKTSNFPHSHSRSQSHCAFASILRYFLFTNLTVRFHCIAFLVLFFHPILVHVMFLFSIWQIFPRACVCVCASVCNWMSCALDLDRQSCRNPIYRPQRAVACTFPIIEARVICSIGPIQSDAFHSSNNICRDVKLLTFNL